jgi:hypothetical protein
MVNITYTASSGHVYDLQAKTILQREANYHVWEWSPVATELQYGAKVSAFGRGPAIYTTQLVFRGPQNQRKERRRKMKNTFGSSVCVTLFGESHGAKIGAVLDGLAPEFRWTKT